MPSIQAVFDIPGQLEYRPDYIEYCQQNYPISAGADVHEAYRISLLQAEIAFYPFAVYLGELVSFGELIFRYIDQYLHGLYSLQISPLASLGRNDKKKEQAEMTGEVRSIWLTVAGNRHYHRMLLRFSNIIHTFAVYGFQQWEIGDSHDVDKSTTEYLFIYG